MGFEPTTATLEGWSSSAELLPLEAPRDLSRSGIIIAGRRGGVYRVSYTASPPLNWFDRLTMSGGDNTHCHSERSEESKASDRSAFRSTPNRAHRFYVQDTSLGCQPVQRTHSIRGSLGILRRSTPQNDRRRIPVILKAVKSPKRLPMHPPHPWMPPVSECGAGCTGMTVK